MYVHRSTSMSAELFHDFKYVFTDCYYSFSLINIYIIFLKNSKNRIQMNLFPKQKETHRHRKQTYGYQRTKEGRGKDKCVVWD